MLVAAPSDSSGCGGSDDAEALSLRDSLNNNPFLCNCDNVVYKEAKSVWNRPGELHPRQAKWEAYEGNSASREKQTKATMEEGSFLRVAKEITKKLRGGV